MKLAEANASTAKDLEEKLLKIEEEKDRYATLFFEQDNIRKNLEVQLAEERAANAKEIKDKGTSAKADRRM